MGVQFPILSCPKHKLNREVFSSYFHKSTGNNIWNMTVIPCWGGPFTPLVFETGLKMIWDSYQTIDTYNITHSTGHKINGIVPYCNSTIHESCWTELDCTAQQTWVYQAWTSRVPRLDQKWTRRTVFFLPVIYIYIYITYSCRLALSTLPLPVSWSAWAGVYCRNKVIKPCTIL